MDKYEKYAFAQAFRRLKLPFSRRLSYMSLTGDSGLLRLHIQKRTYAENAVRQHDMAICPTAYGNYVPCEYDAQPGLLTARAANGGSLEFTYDGADVLRIRVRDADFMYQPNGLFRVETVGENEYAVMEAGTIPPPEYRDFDLCAGECMADYDDWYSMYYPVAPEYERMKRLAVYMVWICETGARGLVREPAILYTKPTEQSCFSWHQVYHAMAMRDADNAVRTLMNMFRSQDEYGELPDLLDDTYVNITATKPPFHGYGLLYILERLGNEITTEHCRHMYGGLEKLYGFWTTLRDTDGDGVPQYNHGCESGYDFSAMFSKGVPVETPDIISYTALLAEGLGKLAERLGMDAAAREWEERAAFLTDKLVTEFWDGERFIAKLSGLHETVEFDELEAFLPLMLGARLPADIVSRLTRGLSDPERYYTPAGLRSQPKKPDAPGVIMGFSQIKILPGLYLSGQRELALRLLRGFCDYGAENAPSFLFVEPEPGKRAGANPGFAGFTELSALSASIWLGCASFLWEAENGKI